MIYITHPSHIREFWMSVFLDGLTYYIIAEDVVVSINSKDVNS